MLRSGAQYKNRPIASIESLGRALNYSADELRAIAGKADRYYRVKVCSEPGKKDRIVHPAREPLKAIHGRINAILFRHVHYPIYLMGGLPDPTRERGYRRSAEQHAGSAMLISEDVSKFYPSVTERQVRCIFQYVLRFTPDVSSLLAKLCTRKGRLVQGASPSTYLANLVFFQYEPALFEYLEERGLKYRRYVDDICVSSQSTLSREQITEIVGLLRSLVEREGLKVNRKKQLIAGRGNPRQIHNLNVDGERATIPLPERKRIRFHVHELEQMIKLGGDKDDIAKSFDSAWGRVARLATFHKRQAAALSDRLKLLKPKVVRRDKRS